MKYLYKCHFASHVFGDFSSFFLFSRFRFLVILFYTISFCFSVINLRVFANACWMLLWLRFFVCDAVGDPQLFRVEH